MLKSDFLPYLLVMAGVTYLLRMVPLVFLRSRIKNSFVISFLHYIPVAVLSVMIVPAVFYASESLVSAVIGFAVAVVFSYLEKSLVQVAWLSCAAVFLTELLLKL